MRHLLLLMVVIPSLALAKIEDNSFLIEEGYNQDWGAYQFIQKYQIFNKSKTYDYSFESEVPITDKVHQFSYAFGYARAEGVSHGAVSDMTLNYRIQPLNKDGFLLADRFGLVVPTGRVEKGAGNGVYGLDFMQAATITVSDRFMSHWNFGFNVLPNAKNQGIKKRGTMTSVTAGTSVIHLTNDYFNILLEALISSGQTMNPDGTKSAETSFTLNPGMRWAWDLELYETQVVQGISFPTEVLNDKTEHGVLLYLSLEPKFN